MPLNHVSAAKDTLSKANRDALMSRLFAAILRLEGAPIDAAAALSLVWAYSDVRPADSKRNEKRPQAGRKVQLAH